MRQTDIIDPKKLGFSIAIIGGGSIGGWAALCLSKLGCTDITVFDFDVVERHNAATQVYNTEDTGLAKTEALQRKLGLLVENPVKVRNEAWTPTVSLKEFQVVIAAVDNITNRAQLFQALKNQNSLYVDARMAGNALEIYTIHSQDPKDQKFYESTLFPEEETLPVPCSGRSVVYNVFFIAGLIGVVISKYANGVEIPRELIGDLTNLTLYK